MWRGAHSCKVSRPVLLPPGCVCQDRSALCPTSGSLSRALPHIRVQARGRARRLLPSALSVSRLSGSHLFGRLGRLPKRRLSLSRPKRSKASRLTSTTCDTILNAKGQQPLLHAKAQALAALAPLKKAAVTVPEVEEWFPPQFLEPPFRRMFLVLCGPSRVGKAVYPRSLLGESHTLEINCAGVLEPDLRAFDICQQKAIVFDEAFCEMCLKHKKLMQGGVEEVTLGHSSINIYSEQIFLHRICLIVTSNTWLQELNDVQPADRHWLEGNTCVIECNTPLFVFDRGTAVPSLAVPPGGMGRCSNLLRWLCWLRQRGL